MTGREPTAMLLLLMLRMKLDQDSFKNGKINF